MSRTYYASILEVSPQAGEQEVKAAYRRMVKIYHPDINPSPRAQDRFLELKKAYDYLIKYPYSYTQTNYQTVVPPAQRREEEEKKKREERMRRAREMRKRKQELEKLAWENFKGSIGMWALVLVMLCVYFVIIGVSVQNIREYPYPDSNVQNPEVGLLGSFFVIALFTFIMYRFYVFLRK